jgi:hypothetical protein
MSFLDTLLGRVVVVGSSGSSSSGSSSSAASAPLPKGAEDNIITNARGCRIDVSFLDGMYHAGKLTKDQREGLLNGLLDPRTLAISEYDLFYLTAGQYGSRILVTAQGPQGSILIDSWIADATEIAGASSETVSDKYLTIPANTLRVGDRVFYAFQGTQNGQNSTDTTRLRNRVGTTTSGASLFDSGTLSLASGAYINIAGELGIVAIGSSGSAKAHASYAGVENGNNSFTWDTSVEQKICATVLHSSSSSSNKTQFKQGYLYILRKVA